MVKVALDDPVFQVTLTLRRSTAWLLLALASLAFAYVALARGGSDAASKGIRVNDVVIDPERVVALRQALVREGATAVSDTAVIAALIDEELLYQAGVAQGWRDDDPVVRRRVVQRVLDSIAAGIGAPDPDELAAFYAARISEFTPATTLRFEQVFVPLRRDGSDGDAMKEAARVLRSAENITAFARMAAAWPDKLRLHDPSIAYPRHQLEEIYGPRFVALLWDSPLDRAAGPYLSSLGAHVVWIRERKLAPPPPLDDVRDAVLDAWRRHKTAEATEAFLRQLRAAANVTVDADPAALSAP